MKLKISILAILLVLCFATFIGCNNNKINDYTIRLNDWNGYKIATYDLYNKYQEKIQNYENDLIDFIYYENEIAILEYINLIIETYNDFIFDLERISPPDCALNLHKYQIESLELQKEEWLYYILNITVSYELIPNYELANEIEKAIERVNEEGHRIDENFNLEAKELGLPIPYP